MNRSFSRFHHLLLDYGVKKSYFYYHFGMIERSVDLHPLIPIFIIHSSSTHRFIFAE